MPQALAGRSLRRAEARNSRPLVSSLRRLRPEFHFILRSLGRSCPQLLRANRLLDHRDDAFSKTIFQVTKIKISLPALRLLDWKFVFRIFAPTYFFTTIPQECCILPNIHYLCEAVRRMATYLFSESVSLILVPKSGTFQANRDRQYRTFITVYSFCIGSRYGDCSVWGIVYLFAGIPEPRY